MNSIFFKINYHKNIVFEEIRVLKALTYKYNKLII